MILKCVLPSFTERCHRSYLPSHTLATRNITVNLPHKVQKERSSSKAPPPPPWKLLLAGHHYRISYFSLLIEEQGKGLAVISSPSPIFCATFIFNANTQSFKNSSVLWKGAGPYNVTDTVCGELWGGISVPLEHYAVVICNDLGADGTNTSSEEAVFVFQAPLLIMCGINIAIFQLVLNMHAISQPN